MKFGRRSHTLLALAIFAGVVAWSGCGDDKKTTGPDDGGNNGGTTVSAAQAGTYNVTVTIKDCVTNVVLLTDTAPDTLCEGESIGDVSGSEGCTVTVSGSTYHVVCSESETVDGCTTTTSTDITMTYGNTSFTGTGTIQLTSSPANCAGFPDTCLKIEFTATRTGAVPAGACP